MPGTTSSTEPRATTLKVDDDTLAVDLIDGRTIEVPLAWYPRLQHGTPEERADWTLNGDGGGIHWPRLDEDVAVVDLLEGRPSGESQASLVRWIDSRNGPV
jgi:hypothetical protein